MMLLVGEIIMPGIHQCALRKVPGNETRIVDNMTLQPVAVDPCRESASPLLLYTLLARPPRVIRPT